MRCQGYEGEEGRSLAARYESLDAAEVHSWLRDVVPEGRLVALDVGAGSGRDAAWLASLGHEVVAAEPSATMLAEARTRHPDPRINWISDSLPSLERVLRTGMSFDLVLLSAVWMHVRPTDRRRAFRKLVSLLKPGGVLALTLRHGPADPAREMHPVDAEEIAALAKEHGAAVVKEGEASDRLGRAEVRWSHVAVRLPDDGTGALPLLRHAILADAKSATYKLGLLRSVARAADGALGMARPVGDGEMSVPLGLIALNWIRLYKPLVDARLPQAPRNAGPEGLGFAKDGWRRIGGLSPLDLRVGARFAGDSAEALHVALRDAAATIAGMPATHLTFPGTSVPVLRAEKARPGTAPGTLLVDEGYLRRFGELRVPFHLWRAFVRLDAWIEPALVAEWTRLMHSYAEGQGRRLDPGEVARAMEWSEPSRDVGLVRRIAAEVLERKGLHCVWTGKRLSAGSLDVDHCMPWSAWPCEDLWNLLPSDPAVNRNHKRQRLPSAEALSAARERLLDWWESAYTRNSVATSERFFAEARSSLPACEEGRSVEDVFQGVASRRSAIRADQQVEEWTPGRGRAS